MSGGTGPAVATGSVAGTSRAVLTAVGKGLLNAAITVGIVLAAWQALIMSGKISPYVAKGPLDVWRFLFVTDPDARATAEERRELLFDLAAVSLKDAAIGFVVGMAIAIVLAVLFTLSKTVEAGVMPLALLLRSIPLVSIAPVIILLTGRGTTASVAVIGSIVVLFPALASVLFGLSRANKESLDSVPGAVTGALLAEWLSTGKGVGGQIVKFNAAAQFDNLWASVAIITLVTLLLYNLVQLAETVVLARMGMSQSQL